MSLRTFHIFFITVATLLACFFGTWGINIHLTQGSTGHLVAGLGSFAVGMVLILYGVWFWKKIRYEGIH